MYINSIAFGKSTSQRIYSKQHTHKIGKKRHKYGLRNALHSLDGHFRCSQYQKNKFRKLRSGQGEKLHKQTA